MCRCHSIDEHVEDTYVSNNNQNSNYQSNSYITSTQYKD